jgi:hypothetical protein
VALPLIIRSNYYKALLVLVRRDRIIDPHERELMLRVGGILDFDRRFCEATIDELLSNTHITREPIVFSDKKIAECFFHDALRLALIDGNLHPGERRWLQRMADTNGKSRKWLDSLIREYKKKMDDRDSSAPLKIQQYS